jgi:methyl-accepting chemotaxis protein
VGVGAINRSMVNVDDVARQNATACEELSTVATEMNSQAGTLASAVSFFRLGNGASAPQPLAAAAAAARRSVPPPSVPWTGGAPAMPAWKGPPSQDDNGASYRPF